MQEYMPKISEKDTIVIFGGTGFIGTYLVKDLAKTKAKIILVCQNHSHERLKMCGFVGQISIISIDIKDEKAITNVIKNADYVINLIGIMFESKRFKFKDLHTDLPKNIAISASKQHVKMLIHISALGVEQAITSNYAASKLQGEKAVRQEFSDAIIIKPSVIFGPEDKFINLFNKILKFSPIMPLIGGGRTKFQPVYVDDISKAITNILQADATSMIGRTFELVGPITYSLQDIISYILKITNRKRWLIHIPFYIAKLEAMMLELLPVKLLSVDQVELLKYDNVATRKEGLSSLGINATPMESIVPNYLR